ncbi:MAG TPA: hypothetical protein VFI29_13200, partial [Hanamia sp.]|nr:hypothetical protein [Hanamia sp.]
NQLIESALADNQKVYIVDYKKKEIEENISKFVGYNLDSYNVFERSSLNSFWAKNLAKSELYINGFKNFLMESEWLRIQIR